LKQIGQFKYNLAIGGRKGRRRLLLVQKFVAKRYRKDIRKREAK
jgi:hypothetical protein